MNLVHEVEAPFLLADGVHFGVFVQIKEQAPAFCGDFLANRDHFAISVVLEIRIAPYDRKRT